jgi:broad specificity phosphatase PhoE
MTTLHLIRHGRASILETDYDQLHPLGELQARLLGEHLASYAQRFDAVYVGPHRRQLETLRLMREAAGPVGASWPEASMLEALAEGPFELLMKNHVRPRLASDAGLQAIARDVKAATEPVARDAALGALFDYMVALWRCDELKAEGLEPASVFDARVTGALDHIVREQDGRREVAVVTSNGVIGRLFLQAGLAPPQGQTRHHLHNSSISLLELTANGATVRAYDRTEHLRDPEHLTLM